MSKIVELSFGINKRLSKIHYPQGLCPAAVYWGEPVSTDFDIVKKDGQQLVQVWNYDKPAYPMQGIYEKLKAMYKNRKCLIADELTVFVVPTEAEVKRLSDRVEILKKDPVVEWRPDFLQTAQKALSTAQEARKENFYVIAAPENLNYAAAYVRDEAAPEHDVLRKNKAPTNLREGLVGLVANNVYGWHLFKENILFFRHGPQGQGRRMFEKACKFFEIREITPSDDFRTKGKDLRVISLSQKRFDIVRN